MKTVHRWLKSILGIAILVLLASCATPSTPYIPNDSTVGNMSVKQARKVLVTLKNNIAGGKCQLPGCNLIDGSAVIDVRVTSDRLIATGWSGKDSVLIFREISQISRDREYVYLASQTILEVNSANPTNIANALYVLKRNAVRTKNAADEYDASFAASLAEHRKKVVSNTALPEGANRYKVQAEGAVRDKDFDAAEDFYAKALEIAPWWPVGHFNRALVLGETGDYEMAIREMKMYLQLVPDAQNARAAQDKIYDWERLDSK